MLPTPKVLCNNCGQEMHSHAQTKCDEAIKKRSDNWDKLVKNNPG